MRTALTNMLTLQDKMNAKVHPDWIAQNFAWYRAIWIECGELMDHQGYKWWKKQTPDVEQVRLEVVDIWHFGMSALFTTDTSLSALAENIETRIMSCSIHDYDVHTATEKLAEFCLAKQDFSVELFWQLLNAADMSFESLYKHYVGKNVLNFFRQDHGYKDGSYIKVWHGREDNEHLSELLDEVSMDSEQPFDEIYAALAERYQALEPA